MTLYLRYRPFFWLLYSLLLFAVLLAGFEFFYFLTDDAFISFRYISNHLDGRGYVWNPAPFIPVEGYTNFLWIVLLEGIWRISGIEPPLSSTLMSLLFSLLTLLLAFVFVLKMRLGEPLRAYRVELAFFIVLAMVTNRTFLAWTSSGLETALFGFLFVSWVYVALYLCHRFILWGFLTTALASLLYLTRPDGILYVLISFLLVSVAAFSRLRGNPGAASLGSFATLLPLLPVPCHLLWRRSFYGQWLPNTYYAKTVGFWPESGVRYLGAFVLEYGLLFWFLVGVVAAFQRRDSLAVFVRGLLTDRTINRGSILVAIIATELLHIAFFTFYIGGDHFEYRIYNHLIAFIYISFAFFLYALVWPGARSAILLLGFLACASFIPWTHYYATKDLNTRGQTYLLARPIAGFFPPPVSYYVEIFDELQHWLIGHSVGMRHQEHKIFLQFMAAKAPERSHRWGEAERMDDDYPVLAAPCVGVLGWRLPNIAIIDTHGLNDYVVARSPVPGDREQRQMAHSRVPPPGYLACFEPNVTGRYDSGKPELLIRKRERPMTAERIRACEKRYIERLGGGGD